MPKQSNFTTVYQNSVLKVEEFDIEFDSGIKNRFSKIIKSDSVIIVPITSDNEIVFIKEYHPAIDQTFLTLPGGRIDVKESPEQAAFRELKEETGGDTHSIYSLGVYSLSPGYIDQKTYAFFATNVVIKNQSLESTEQIQISRHHLDEIDDLIKNHQLFEARDIAACLMAKSKLKYQQAAKPRPPITEERYLDWVKYPTGKIDPGSWCQHCGRFNNRVCTITMVVVAENRILMIKRNHDPESGAWAMPGGYLDWNETLAECAARELREETGIKINPPQFFKVYDHPSRDKDGRQNVDHAFVIELPSIPENKIDPIEVSDLKWFAFDELPTQIAFDHRQILTEYLKSKNYI